jgi:LmbE family N-acetylglucosaminyl deacetylase
VLNLDFRRGEGLHVLALGAHADDIEIGCGGTILRLAEEVDGLAVTWVVLSAEAGRRDEAEAGAAAFLDGVEHSEVDIQSFQDAFFRYGPEVKEYFEGLKAKASPDLILTHHGSDLHQDHRLVAELTWNTFRDHLILEYEIPKYDGDMGAPNVFVPLGEEVARRKVEALLACFPSQADKHWFGGDVFTALMRLRGMESRSPSGLAEGFYGRKLVL